VDALFQAVRDLQHHVLLARAARAHRAGVFAAVSRVERDDDEAVGLLRLGGGGRVGGGGGGGGGGRFGGQRAARGGGRGGWRGQRQRPVPEPFVDQRFQRIDRRDRIEVEHQAVLVGGDRIQGEHLGGRGLFQVDHHAHHAGLELGRPDARDEGIVGA